MSAPNLRTYAFPIPADSEANGMLLRDYFAAQALPFCLQEFGGNADDQRQYAEAAYQIADAMLAERAKVTR